ncbi:MAG: D-glycerate dehydrogenase [Anaerolineae bacterium]|nr:D-glycerate dehydrogenase [Anaerolineae bacterium]
MSLSHSAGFPHVVITRRVPQHILDYMASAADLQLWEEDHPIPYQTLLDRVPGCAGVYCLLTDRIDAALLDAAGPGLKVISQMAVGVDNIDVKACTARGIPVGNTPGVLTETTADLALALMLATARRIVEAAEFLKAGQWQTWRPMELTGQDVYGCTVGIIGLGRIGTAVARRLRGFDCKLLYTNPSPNPEAEKLGVTDVDLETLLKSSDIVTLHCPLTPETRGLIGAGELALMKPTAILINTARGAVVDQKALFEALQARRIGAAGLDVTDPEPMSKDDPLLTLPNVVVLPHIGSASVATRTRMAQLAADNLVAGLQGEHLPHCVNPEVYD